MLCYAMSGTDVVYAAICLPARYAMPGTDIGDAAVCDEMCGTDVAYADTREGYPSTGSPHGSTQRGGRSGYDARRIVLGSQGTDGGSARRIGYQTTASGGSTASRFSEPSEIRGRGPKGTAIRLHMRYRMSGTDRAYAATRRRLGARERAPYGAIRPWAVEREEEERKGGREEEEAREEGREREVEREEGREEEEAREEGRKREERE
eukprot:335966-Rhodomonas_salina.2